MKITYHFSTPQKFNLFSWAIRKVSNAPFSHVVVGFELDGIRFITESTTGGVRIQTYKRFVKDNKIFQEYNLEQNLDYPEITTFKEVMIRYVSTRFGYFTLLGIGFSRWISLLGVKGLKFFEDKDKTLVCSEWAWLIATSLGCKFENFEPEYDDPKKFYEELKDALANK